MARRRSNGMYSGDNLPGNPYARFLRRKRVVGSVAGGGGDTYNTFETSCYIPSIDDQVGLAWELHGLIVHPRNNGDVVNCNDGGSLSFKLYAGTQAADVAADNEDFVSGVMLLPDDAGGDGGCTYSLPVAMPLVGPVVVADKIMTFHVSGAAAAAANTDWVLDVWYAPLPADRVTLLAMLAAAGRLD